MPLLGPPVGLPAVGVGIPQWSLASWTSGAVTAFTWDTLTQSGILATSVDGVDPGSADLQLDVPASWDGDLYRGSTIPPRDLIVGVFIADPDQGTFLAIRDRFLLATTLGSQVTVSGIRGDGVTKTVSGVVESVTGSSDTQSVGLCFQALVLTVHCSDPFWHDPAVTVTFAVTSSGGSFGVPFPVPFGGTINQTATVTITGSQPAEPVWTLTGPWTSPLQLAIVGGAQLTLNYAAVPGEVVTIDTRRGQQSVQSNLTGNLFPLLSNPSQLFPIPPGVQQVQVAMNGATAASAAALTYSGRWQYL